MTFVALLAGERHTDSPRTASPFIRNFAVRLNDHIPAAQRQQLKFFAPRIIGTRDECDNLRGETVRSSFAREILPQLERDGAQKWLAAAIVERITLFAKQPFASVESGSLALFDRFRLPGAERELDHIARMAADLLIACARSAPAEKGAWYWAKAIELLDLLCDIGRAPTNVAISERAIEQAGRRLEGRPFRPIGLAKAVGLWHDLIAWISDQPAQTLPASEAQYRVMKSASNSGGDWDEIWTLAPTAAPPLAADISKSAGRSPSKLKTPSP